MNFYDEDSNGCWNFRFLSHDGYPVGGILRCVYRQEVGNLPTHLHVHHTCENPACIRPSHLEAITQLENNRRRRATRVPHTDYPAIQEAIANGTRVAEIADRYGVTTERIYQIKTMKLTASG